LSLSALAPFCELEPSEDRSRTPRSAPTGLSGHYGARPAVLLVSGIGANAEVAGLVRAAASARRRGLTLKAKLFVASKPHALAIKESRRGRVPKNPETGYSE
jgi:hypothetical protein